MDLELWTFEFHSYVAGVLTPLFLWCMYMAWKTDHEQ
jgi:hypothetical protein